MEQLGDTGVARSESFDEGLRLQILHVGPYHAVGPVLARIHGEEIPAQDLVIRELHHEINLGDARRAGREDLRTILR